MRETMNITSPRPQVLRERGPITACINEMSNAVEELHTAIDELADTVSPIMTPPAPEPVNDSKTRGILGGSATHEDLISRLQSIRLAAERVRSLKNRIEL